MRAVLIRAARTHVTTIHTVGHDDVTGLGVPGDSFVTAFQGL